MLLFISVFVIIVVSYLKFRRSRQGLYRFAQQINTVGELPILGHTHWFFGGPEKLFNNIRTLVEKMEDTDTICRAWIGPSLYIVPSNLDDVQKILELCLEKDYSYKFLRAWLGNGLFVAPRNKALKLLRQTCLSAARITYVYEQYYIHMSSCDHEALKRLRNISEMFKIELWKSHRRLLLPVFGNRIIEEYIEVFGKQGDILVKRLQHKVGEPYFDVYEYITACMLDVVFEVSMAQKMNVQSNSDTPYLRARKTVMSIINLRLFKAWLQPDALFQLTRYATTQKENIDVTHKFTDEVIKKKKTAYKKIKNNIEVAPETEYHTNNGPKDLLQILLESDMNFSSVELREHIDSITIAGNDTTALVISYVLVLLGTHPDKQNKVYKELKCVFGDSKRKPTKEDLVKMKYLERVIKETMRLYTVVPIIARKTQKELKLSTCTVPAGVGCAIVPFVLHRSKKIWGPDADNFNPDRFLKENCASRHPCAFIPFSSGPRNCIGRHFAFLVMKSILSNILRNFKISSKTCSRLKIEILLFPLCGHLISLERRSNESQ